MTFIYTPPPAASSAVTPVFCQTITLAAIQGLIASNTLVCGRLYTITNPFSNPVGYGTVTVKATSSNTVDPVAVWNKPPNQRSIGGVLYDSSIATGNTIDDLIVNGTNLISGPVVFNSSLAFTMVDLANNINALAATTLVATATPSGVILADSVVQTTFNNSIPSSTTTGFPGPIQTYTLLYGEDSAGLPLQYPVVYDVNNANLLSCYDFRTNNNINAFNNDTTIFTFPFNYSIVNSTFTNTFFNQASIYGAFIDIDNCTFNNCAFFNILFNNLQIIDSTLNNYQSTAGTDGINFGISNSNLLYPKLGPGTLQGSFILNPLLFVNVETDGRKYTCSGDVSFNGSPGGGAIGSPIFMQTSPARFAYKATYRLQLFGQGIVSNPGATLEIGTDTNPAGLVNAALSTAFNGVVTLPGNNFGPDVFGQFNIQPKVDDTNSGVLTYVITGFTPA